MYYIMQLQPRHILPSPAWNRPMASPNMRLGGNRSLSKEQFANMLSSEYRPGYAETEEDLERYEYLSRYLECFTKPEI